MAKPKSELVFYLTSQDEMLVYPSKLVSKPKSVKFGDKVTINFDLTGLDSKLVKRIQALEALYLGEL